jgi:hypothetical protein
VSPLVPCGLLALAGFFLLAPFGGTPTIVALVVLTQTLFLYGWWRLPIAAVHRGVAIAGAAALASDVVVVGARHRVDAEAFAAAAVVGLLGVGVVVAFVAQLARRDGRAGVTPSVAAGVAALLVACAGAGWIRLGVVPHGEAAGVAASVAAGLAVGAVLAGLRLRAAPAAVLAAAAVVGAVAGLLLSALVDVGPLAAAAAGLGAASLAVATLSLASPPGERLVAVCLGSTVPVLVVGPLVPALLHLSGG